MYYTIYKITNKINGKFYIGSHKTNDLNDSYMGSGKYLKHAIEKHGVDNFTKEILFVFDNPEEMYAKEAEIVNEDFLSEENTYNLKVGGFGGWDYVNSRPEIRRTSVLNTKQTFKKLYGFDSACKNPEIKTKISISMKYSIQKRKEDGSYIEPTPPSFSGLKHSEETKKKISKSAKDNLSDPRKNSQFGTMWITNGSENKKIKKFEQIPEGWVKGRTMNYGE